MNTLKLNKIASIFFFAIILLCSSFDKALAQDPVVITEDSTIAEDRNPSNELSKKTFKQRLKFGGAISSASFSNQYANFGLSPLLGYQATPNLTLGAGLSYQYFKVLNDDVSLFGQKIFARQELPFFDRIINGSYLIAQIENVITPSNSPFGKFSNPVLLGLGFGILNVMIDLNYKNNQMSPYESSVSPLMVQVSGFF
ncbi:MAG: hypothetical protein KA313_09270 [Pseudarcicella sp.]|nr:hypothetical protein [Pseudarcicella sp.]